MIVIERITLPDIEPVDHEPEVDISHPFAVWIDATGERDCFEVNARRPDRTILTLIRGIPRADALRVAARVRDALDHDEAWAERLIDSSAGKLRE